jgi:ABC-type nitrate/sulfonate/bicarbonate transport system substrate-binding protein
MGESASLFVSAPNRVPLQIPARPGHIRIIADNDEAGRCSAILHQQAAVAAITARTRGAATRLVGISRIDDFQALIVRRDAKLRRGADLRDRRIGLPVWSLESGGPRIHALRAAIAVLESQGLFFRGVEWVDLLPAEAVTLTLPSAYAAEMAALQDGSVDAVYVRGPAGLEAARAAGARVLVDLGAHRDPWLRAHTALLHTVTVNETLLREHPDVIAQELLQRWPQLPPRLSLDAQSLDALATLKVFMLRWVFIGADFDLDTWTD